MCVFESVRLPACERFNALFSVTSHPSDPHRTAPEREKEPSLTASLHLHSVSSPDVCTGRVHAYFRRRGEGGDAFTGVMEVTSEQVFGPGPSMQNPVNI